MLVGQLKNKRIMFYQEEIKMHKVLIDKISLEDL